MITLVDVSYSFFSVASVRQFYRDTTAVFIVALMGLCQQARGQVLRFGGTKNIFTWEIFFIISLKQTVHDQCQCNSSLVQFIL